LIGAAVTEPSHHSDGCNWIGAATTVLVGDRHSLHAERSAFFPAITREDLLGIPLNHIIAQLLASEFNRCLL
jgi:hypothetical protein